METQLVYDNKGKNLGLAFKETFNTDNNLILKIRGVLNTHSSHVDYRGSLQKFFFSKPFRKGSAAQQTLEKKRVKFGAGLAYVSGTDDILVGLTAKKLFKLGTSESWLGIKATADYNTMSQEFEGKGKVRLSKSIYSFTDTQDIRLVVGARGSVTPDGNFTWEKFGQLRENNWQINTDFKGYWGIRYDL